MFQNLNKISPLPDSILEYLKLLVINNNIKRLILFGSRVFGDFDPKSDIDLAIEFKASYNHEFIQINDFVKNHLHSLFYLSLVDFNNSPERLKNKIINEGVILYEHKES